MVNDMDRKKPIQYTLNVPDKTGPFPLVEFEWDFRYVDIISRLKYIHLFGDISDCDVIKERIDIALENYSLIIVPVCLFRIESSGDGDSSEYVYFIYDGEAIGSVLAVRLVYDSENNFMLAGIHKANDFFDRDSRFYMECYLNLHDDSVLLFDFFHYHASLRRSGDYKGEFYEFLECDEILDYINYFKMIEY